MGRKPEASSMEQLQVQTAQENGCERGGKETTTEMKGSGWERASQEDIKRE